MHIKGILKTIENVLNPEWYQTNDNNVDLANQFENVVLTEEFMEIQKNQKTAMDLLKDYCYFRAARDENLLLTEKDKIARAEDFYNKLLDCNLINRGMISRHIVEEILNVVNQ